MAKKKDDKDSESGSRADPKQEERRRLRALAFSRKLLSKTPSRPPSPPLRPSAAVVRHQGRDLVKKGLRRNRFLFSFPGFIAPIGGGGKIGELADLGTGNPVLYLEFPQGRLKLFGTIVYPKNRYLTLQFARKNVLCEDTFDNMVVFSDAWWIGRKEENPEELKLDFPKELNEVKDVDYDFKGGVSACTGDKPIGKSAKDIAEPLSPETEIKDDDTSQDFLPETEDNITNSTHATPVRQSSRLVGKSLNFTEKSSGEESVGNDSGDSDSDDSDSVHDVDKVENALYQVSSGSKDTDLKNQLRPNSEISSLEAKSPENSSKKIGRLVQSSLSTLFQKASEKKADTTLDVPSEPKGSGAKRQRKGPIDKPSAANGSKKRSRTAVNTGVKRKLKLHQEEKEEEDIEEISSESSEDDSDEEWVA